MMNDIRSGKINCVAVKDLSRFGRNYIESGKYIEEIFPFLGVRFISVSDGLDSFRNPDGMNTLLVPFKNLLNDEYCRDISVKTRRILDLKRRKGEFIGSFAPFGYVKDPADGHHLLVDARAAAVVRDIFDWYLSGMSKRAVADRLNGAKIPSPALYKSAQYPRYRPPGSGLGGWLPSSVGEILKNPVYAGDMAQGKHPCASYKIHRQLKLPAQDWIVVPNTHEPIISRDTFLQAARLQARTTHTAPREEHVRLFSGMLRCADCGSPMHRQQAKGRGYYCCSRHKRSPLQCARHGIREDLLREALIACLQAQLIPVPAKAPARERCISPAAGRRRLLCGRLRALESERGRNLRFCRSLYEDWKEGVLSRDEYSRIKASYEEEDRALSAQIAALRDELNALPDGNESGRDSASRKAAETLRSLPRAVLTGLIDEILICEDGRVVVRLICRDGWLSR